MRDDIPEAPDHLGERGRRFWEDICREYALEAADLARLEVAADALDRATQARAALQTDGLDRVALSCWRDSAKIFMAATKSMGLDESPSAHGPRPVGSAPEWRS